MNMRSLLIWSCVVGVTVQFYHYFNLPETVANHFGTQGLPDGWMSKEKNLGFGVGILVLMTLLFGSMPLTFSKCSPKYINFPNKHYWLAPERKAESIIAMSEWIAFYGVLTNVFVIIVMHLVFVANHSVPIRINEQHFGILLLSYLLITGIWIVQLYKKFGNSAVKKNGGSV